MVCTVYGLLEGPFEASRCLMWDREGGAWPYMIGYWQHGECTRGGGLRVEVAPGCGRGVEGRAMK